MVVDVSTSEQDLHRLQEFANHALAEPRPLQRLTIAGNLLTALRLIRTDGCVESSEPGYSEQMRGSQVLIFRGAATAWLKHSPNAVLTRNLVSSTRADRFVVAGKQYTLSSFGVDNGVKGERIKFWINGDQGTSLDDAASVLQWLLAEIKFEEAALYARRLLLGDHPRTPAGCVPCAGRQRQWFQGAIQRPNAT